MPATLRPVSEQVIVVTGASSGIGLVTAQQAAKAGAKVVLAARGEKDLANIVAGIEAEGGQALAVTADVGQREDHERVARAALDRFGRIDTWVNNAGVSIVGPLMEVSDEDHRKLFETNFWGVVYGSTEAARHLRADGGAIVNVGSELSDISVPLQGMYSASKHAVKGFTDALRMELGAEGAPISVTLVKPASINTPYTRHARNYTDHAVKLPPPVYAPQEVAAAILHAAAHPRRELYVGGGARMMSAFGGLFPKVIDLAGRGPLFAAQQRAEPNTNPEGNLWSPPNDGTIDGNHPGVVMRPSLYTRAAFHPAASRVALGAGGLAAVVALRRAIRR